MPQGYEWNDPSHVGKSLVSIYDVMAKKFFADSKTATSDQWVDLYKLVSTAGYVAQMYASLLKTHEFEKRLKRIEKTLKNTSAEELAMKYNPTIVHPELVTQDPLR